MVESLDGKVALITGGGTGIGRSTAELMAARGAQVVVVGRRREPLDEVVAAIGPAASAITTDMTDPAAVEQLAAAVLAKHVHVDIVVNNAGFSSQGRHPLRTTAEEFRAVVDVNALGPIVLTRELLPGMIARGGGDVVLVNSMAALNPSVFPGVPYSAAKAAARAYMQVLAQEMRGDGIRCIDVFPGEVDTPILDNRPLAPDADARATMMMPEDIAEVIVLAVSLPRRTTMLEVALRPTQPREMAAEVQASRDAEAPG